VRRFLYGRVLTAGPVEAILTSSTAFVSESNEEKNQIEAANSRNIGRIIDPAAAMRRAWRLLFFCRHVGAAERFGAISHQHKGLGSDIGNLVVVFGAEKDDLVFLDDSLFTL
jgi:hypothetical protein